ncbi:cytidylyltransferase [candidate division WWE3 bacterium RIFCSPLOWO2_02_FULL_53_10]|uniref:Cytidylyltransferase n=1 Tax=candidate division WWE3 bacterium RIFCSPLOWO2_02_FULL_53_10 TaxID=1802629 RepID=A0A1F4W5D0_UNCKA|nr:MAG: cytidylyltransferase [candidate division WWE3 bacterium RIFCSPLOWO2_02_FULL_53_10]
MTRAQKVLGVTAARGGSKGVPRKNIRQIGGIPLIAYTIREAKKSRLISRYIVSTDDDEIAEVARHYGAEVLMRPAELAEDHTPMIAVMQHALKWCEEEEGEWYDIVADLRCTNPLKTAHDIDGAIEKLIHTGADGVIGVTKLDDHHPARIKRVFEDRLIDFAWPEPPAGLRQELKPDAFIRNGSLYVVLRDALLDGILLQGSDNLRPWYMPLEKSVNIDSELNFVLVEALLGRNRQI